MWRPTVPRGKNTNRSWRRWTLSQSLSPLPPSPNLLQSQAHFLISIWQVKTFSTSLRFCQFSHHLKTRNINELRETYIHVHHLQLLAVRVDRQIWRKLLQRSVQYWLAFCLCGFPWYFFSLSFSLSLSYTVASIILFNFFLLVYIEPRGIF